MELREHIAAADSAARERASAAARTTRALRQAEPFADRQYAGSSQFYAPAKRALDLSVSLALLVALSPVLVAIALLVRLDSAGPSFFLQGRLGRDGKPFRILKFRTMHVLEDGDDVRQVGPNDSRVTRIGGWLRTTSLDELPQLINVVRGEMSLVGPRPHAIAHDRLYGTLIGSYALRRCVKPGITGWAQVNGLRGATPELGEMMSRVAHDLWYVRNASFWLDLKIIARTPLELIHHRNAS